MKILNLVLLVLLLAGGVAAQTSPTTYPDPPGVTVIKNSWHAKARDRKLEEDPLGPTHEQAEKDNYRKHEEEIRGGGSPPPLPRPTVWRNPTKSRPSVEYFFEATISNTGTKKIRRLIWEYVFLSKTTGREVGYRPFVSLESISPGKSKKLIGTVIMPLANLADGAKAGQETQGRFIERVFIRQIEYDDNTVWRRPSK